MLINAPEPGRGQMLFFRTITDHQYEIACNYLRIGFLIYILQGTESMGGLTTVCL